MCAIRTSMAIKCIALCKAIMFSIELLSVSAAKALVEIAALALFAQGIVGVLAGKSRTDNFIYRLLGVMTAPVLKLARRITPKFIADAHTGLATFFILFWLWVVLIYAKASICHTQHLACVPVN